VVRLYGADALRYTILSGAGVGTDLYLNYEDLEATFAPGRNFANKVWNAGRLVLMNVGAEPVQPVEAVCGSLELADRWILSRLSAAVGEVTRHLESYRLNEAALEVRRFFWDEFADWYLELVKPRLRGEAGPESREAAKAALVEAMDVILRLMHPLVPFVSEALWERLPVPAGVEREPSLVVARWPAARPERVDPAAEAALSALMELIGAVRALRSEYGVPPAHAVEVHLTRVPEALREALRAEERALLGPLARAARVVLDGEPRVAGRRPAGAHAVLRSGAELFIPLEGVIDVARERERLAREAHRLRELLRAAEARLADERFLARAPAAVVAREREKAEALRLQVERLDEKLAALV